MTRSSPPTSRQRGGHSWLAPVLISLLWIAVIALPELLTRGDDRVLSGLLALMAVVWTFLVLIGLPRMEPAAARSQRDAQALPAAESDADSADSQTSEPVRPTAALTRSGLFDVPLSDSSTVDGAMSGDFSIIDMVSRLEPVTFHWIESSMAEQQFLGWTLSELQRKSILDVVHPDDAEKVASGLREAIARGEMHGLEVRVRTSCGTHKTIEINASARYRSDHSVKYLRCHIADVTDKVRSERDLRLRTRELTRVNEQLRQINRELEELKDRYSNLYENSPAMYFSLDPDGRVIECNQTLLSTLGRQREELIGRGFDQFVWEEDLDHCRELHCRLLAEGSVESEARWVRASGDLIDVLVSGRLIRKLGGGEVQSHCAAQDLTAKRQLEAELREKNHSLARANAELSEKNRELDEFVYVVSHDLQEPLRTLIGFSGFLLKEQGHLLDARGREYVEHLVDASRRMRSMIVGLLSLSRAGRVTDEFEPVDLAELLGRVRTDLGELIRTREARVVLVGSSVTLWGDRWRLHQLLANLVSNGIKYNRSAYPTVEVGQFRSSGGEDGKSAWTTLFVRDDGIGIEPRHHEKIFRLFRRLHLQEEFEGTGVGLTICSKIVQAHGGQLCLESDLGKGTTFYVRLPSRVNAAPDHEPTAISS